MWDFKKYDVVNFSLTIEKKSNKVESKTKKYSYIWEYDIPEKIIVDILKDGKKYNENEMIYILKKEKYILKLISIKELNHQSKRLINEINFLKENNKKLIENIELEKNQKNKFKIQIDDLNMKQIEEANKFKSEVLNIQTKAQEMINEHKKKANEHQEIQIEEAKKYALQKLIEELLQPLNNFELAILAAKKKDDLILKNFIIGFEMLYNQIENKLADIGLTKIIPNVGDMFDSNIHQIYELIVSDMTKDTILEVKNIGYKLHDRVIKPALVIVSK